jgi:GNAT superfamily N-acetyltransferase
MDTQEVTRRVLRQRMGRYQDTGPALASVGEARFRVEPGLLHVALASIAPGRADEAVGIITEFGRRQRMRVQWVVVPQRAGEVELPPALRSYGFTLSDDLRLMAHHGRIRAPAPPAGGVAVRPIDTWEAMWHYEYGSRQSFYHEPQPAESAVTQRATERWREQGRGWYRYFAALAGGGYAGGCYVSLYEDIPTIMGVYTLPLVRRKGVARTLLTWVVDDIVATIGEHCCLFVEQGNPAEILYRGLGFVALAEMQTFAWAPQ